MDKGLIDLIPAAVEAVKQESMKKMKFFSSDGKAGLGGGVSGNMSADDIDRLTRLVTAEVLKYYNKK